jgi:hypothetical protein
MASFEEQKIAQALEDLRTRKFTSIRAAATAHGLKRSTLTNRYNGGRSRQTARVAQQLLSQEQEISLVEWILSLEKQGHALTHAQVREMALLISKISGGPEIIGHNWVSRFLRRHPEIHTKVGVKIDTLRVQNTTTEALQAWFGLFESVQTTFQVDIANVWNMDETGIALGVCANQTVIGSSSTSRCYKKSPENREWVSIIEAISASGRRTRPLVIFKGQQLQSTWFNHEKIPDSLYTTSTKGWTSNAICLRWLREIFLPETDRNGQPRILLLDGHGSHVTVEFMWECYQNQVYLVYLIPHSSHILQPLDLACFSALKSRYRSQIAELARFEDSAPIKKIRFLEYYHKARDEGLTSFNILSGWRTAGISPWDPRKVIRSSQLLENNQIHQPEPPQTPHKRKISASEETINTPHNKRQFLDNIDKVQAHHPISRPVRMLLSKTGKALDLFHTTHAQNSLQLQAQQRQIDEFKAKKQKKVAIDSNQLFADITKIKAVQDEQERLRDAWEQQDRVVEARNTANQMLASQIARFQHQFHVLDRN